MGMKFCATSFLKFLFSPGYFDFHCLPEVATSRVDDRCIQITCGRIAGLYCLWGTYSHAGDLERPLRLTEISGCMQQRYKKMCTERPSIVPKWAPLRTASVRG